MEGHCVFMESWVGLGGDTGGVLGIHGNLFGAARGQWKGFVYSWQCGRGS